MTQRKRPTGSVKQQDASTVVARAVKRCLSGGEPVELEGLGVFVPDADTPMRFVPSTAPRIFIAYAIEDLAAASRLYGDLTAAGMSPWLDRHKLLPGQAWSKCIERAIKNSDFFIACFSAISSVKKGQFPYEIRCALKWADRIPLDDEFLIPIRLDRCSVPRVIAEQTQCLDMFPDWDRGLTQLITSIRAEMLARRTRRAA
jgi:hypothetical protein